MRIEEDSIGKMALKDNFYYGIQTKRAINNFDVSGKSIGEYFSFINAVARIKQAAALANGEGGRLGDAQVRAICRAAEEICEGKLAGQFPVDIFHGGGGTAANMNVNEVIANRANELLTGRKGYDAVHPNTHVNMGQSTNDVIPAAMRMAMHEELGPLLQSLARARAVVSEKAEEFSDVVKLGRTCLQDALPLTMGQYLSGWQGGLARVEAGLAGERERLLELPLPGTAIGTCFGAAPGFAEVLYTRLNELCGKPFRQEANLFDGLQNADVWITFSSGLKSVAALFNKISADLRLLSSGPRAGFNEIFLPAVQPGSSIMPGKINPVMPEMMLQIGFRVFGNDLAVSLAADRGELELNVWESLILSSLMESVRLLERGIGLLADRCLAGLAVNEEACRAHAQSSLALSTALATLRGYPLASDIARKAHEQGTDIATMAVAEGLMDKAAANRLFDPANLTDIHLFAAQVERGEA